MHTKSPYADVMQPGIKFCRNCSHLFQYKISGAAFFFFPPFLLIVYVVYLVQYLVANFLIFHYVVISLNHSQQESFCFRIQYGTQFTCFYCCYWDLGVVPLLYNTLLHEGLACYALQGSCKFPVYTEENVYQVLKDGTRLTGDNFKDASVSAILRTGWS